MDPSGTLQQIPGANAGRSIKTCDPPSAGKDKGQRVVTYLVYTEVRDICYQNSQISRAFDWYVVDSDTITRDYKAPLR
jgi:hypothetical protein